MAGHATYDHANDILNYLFRGVALPAAGGTLYLRLLVAASTRADAGTGTETNYGGYARLALPRDSSIFSAPSAGVITNAVEIAFPAPSSVGNGDLVAFDVVDTPSGAFTKRYRGGPIIPTVPVVVGKPPTFDAEKLVFSN